jgi:hypothetical protein
MGETLGMAFRSPPSVFPSRHAYSFDVAVPDRQSWAIGMVAAQWGTVELLMRIHVHKLVGRDDATLKAQFDAQADFRHKRELYQTLVEERITAQPQRSIVLALIEDIKRLKHERDRVMHASWGGGMEGSSPSADGLPTTDGEILGSPLLPGPSWKLSYSRLRKIATDLAELNRRFAPICMSAGNGSRSQAG